MNLKKCFVCGKKGYESILDNSILCGKHRLELLERAYETINDGVCVNLKWKKKQ